MKDLSKYLKPASDKGLAAVKAKVLGTSSFQMELDPQSQSHHKPLSSWVSTEPETQPHQRHDSESEDEEESLPVDEDGDLDLPISAIKEKKPPTVFRDKSGKVVDIASYKTKEEERREQNEDMVAQWGGGLTQKAEKQTISERLKAEASKPFSRYEIEEEVDEELRNKDRFGDPFATLGEGKKRPRTEEIQCIYHTSNRFGIAPGKKWDGVDRSNGFEARFMSAQAEKRAKAPEHYREANLDM